MRERNDVRTRYTARHAGKYTAHGEIRKRRIFLFRSDFELGRFLFLFIEKRISESSLAEISPRRGTQVQLVCAANARQLGLRSDRHGNFIVFLRHYIRARVEVRDAR